LDFETKIIVKKNAPALLDAEFSRAGWQPQVVALSGNTDCYQPVERTLGLTRKCLRVFLAHRNPVAMITKNALVLRDLDILKELAALGLVSVAISITTMDNELTRVMEPRTSAPHKRFAALAALIESGIPACVMIAPVIPGINDHEIPAILAHAASLGVQRASYILLRLPYQVKELFSGWLQQHFPDKKNKVLNTVMETRAGKLNDPNFGKRMSGTGVRAETIRRIFEVNCRKYHMNEAEFILRTDLFVRAPSNQMILF
jgi:DNA repair photolyase